MKTIRSFIKAFFRTYLVSLGLISLPFTILLISSYWIRVNHEVVVYGLTFSFLSSFVIAYNFRHYEKSVTFSNANLFVNNLIDSLIELGFLVKNKTADSIEFEPTVHAHLFAGNIIIHLADNSATIEGARLQVLKSLELTLNRN